MHTPESRASRATVRASAPAPVFLTVIAVALTAVLPAPGAAAPIPLDRVPGLVDVRPLDGTPDAPALSTRSWVQLRHELVHAGELDWASARALAGQADGGVSVDAAGAIHRIPVGIVDARVDGVAAPGEASGERRVFAAAALLPTTYRGTSVRLRIPRAAVLTHETAPLTSLELDLDDGRGFRPVGFDVDLPASYATAGARHLRLRATDADGVVLEAGFALDVRAAGTPVPQDTLTITGTPYLGASASGRAFVYRAPGHAELVDPVVVIEGFDLDNSLQWDELYEILNQQNLLEDLRSAGYDAVVLDFDDATDYLQRNGSVVRALVEEVETLVPDTDVALVGASMGGLLARYALASLEHDGGGHAVDRYLSFDAPHTGANIPLGVQYWVAFFADESAEAAALLAALDSPASRQLLVYHYTDPVGTTGEPDPLRQVFLDELAAMGDFPILPRSVAIANGSGSMLDQGFGGGDQVVDWEYRSFIVDVDGDVYAVPDGGTALVFDGLLDVIGLPADVQQVTVTGTEPYDHAPGGFRPSMAQMDEVDAPFGDIVALHPAHAFIPTVSALALSGVELFHDVAGDPDLLTRTPFDALYYPVENQEHVAITEENVVWFLTEIGGSVLAAGAPSATRPTDLTISPNPFRVGTTLELAPTRAGRVDVRVFDAGGREVAALGARRVEAGPIRLAFDGRDHGGRPLAPGVYLVRVTGPDGLRTGKLILGR